MSFRLTRTARRDIDDLWFALARRDVAAASAAVNGLSTLIELLGTHPYLGRERSDLRSDLRSLGR